MPTFPIIDTHLHIWDQTRLKYSAFAGSPLFRHLHVEHGKCRAELLQQGATTR